MEEFREFQAFEVEAEAEALKIELEEAGIAVNVVRVNNYLDNVISGQLNSPQQFIIQLLPNDFVKAEKLFDKMAEQQVEDIPEDYHLYEFTDDELMEIVDQPDEWSKIDYHLAIRILRDRGRSVSYNYLQRKKDESLEAQKTSQRVANVTLFSGYLCILLGIGSAFLEFPFGLFVVAWPIVLGGFLFSSKKTLKDGSRYFFYDENSRKHGVWMFILGTIAFFVPIAIAFLVTGK